MGVRRSGSWLRSSYLLGLFRTVFKDVEGLRLGFHPFVSPFRTFEARRWVFTDTSIHSILWIALFGVFGKLFIKEDPEGDGGITRMKHAVWIDLINALLWLFTAIYGGIAFWSNHSGRSLHTGRATV